LRLAIKEPVTKSIVRIKTPKNFTGILSFFPTAVLLLKKSNNDVPYKLTPSLPFAREEDSMMGSAA
jgi:hypothetical protein